MNKAKTVIEYYVLCNKLKYVIRSGWKNWNVSKDRIESVAEHIYGVQTLAVAMWSQYEYELDFNKVIFMLAIHELEETIIGDLTAWDISINDKLNKGHDAIKLILKDFLKKDILENLILEFDLKKTKEAIFAYHCDKLECDIQAKLYGEENCVDLTKQENNKSFCDKDNQKLLKEENDWAKMWLSYGRKHYNYDENFKEVSNYVSNNKIGLK